MAELTGESRISSGVYEPTNQRTLGIREEGPLKRQELKESISDREGTQNFCSGQYEMTVRHFVCIVQKICIRMPKKMDFI